MASIADLFLRLLPDDSGLKAEVTRSAQAAGDSGGKAASSSLAKGLKTGLKVGLAGLGAGMATAFGVGLKGVIELDNVMADFQAETGATGAEAQAAGDKILDLSRKNLQPLSEIGATMAALRTQQGLTQKEAEALTQSYLDFARVTGQDGPTAVKAFDDILDSFNLTAKDGQGLMDQLIVSHQKFGGVISENEATLSALAPAMKAANFQVDDGIAILNLFGSKGLDAGVASAAFAKALTKVKSPDELKALIQQITETPDDFRRAQLAADLFGAKAGAKLANALRPSDAQLAQLRKELDAADPSFRKLGINVADGEKRFAALRSAGVSVKDSMTLLAGPLKKISATRFDELTDSMQKAKTPADALQLAEKALGKAGGKELATALEAGRKALLKGKSSLDEYKIGADQAAGATKKAADEQNASFGKQAQLWIKNIQGMATGLVKDLGPGIGGVATAATLALPALGGLGRGILDIGKSIGPKLLSGLLALGPLVSGAGAAIGGAFTAAASAVIAAWPLVLIALVVAAIVLLIANPDLRNAALGVGKAILDFIGKALGAIAGVLGGIAKAIGDFFGSLIGGAIDAAGKVAGAIGNAAAAVIGFILGIPAKVLGWVAALIGQAAQIYVGIWKAILGLVANIVGAILSIPIKVIGWVASLLGQAGQVAGGVLKAIAGMVGSVVGAILSIPGKVVGWVGGIIGQAASAGVGFARNVAGFVGNAVGTILSLPGRAAGFVGGLVGSAASAAAGFVGRIAGMVGSVVSTIVGIPGQFIGGLVSGFANAAAKAVGAFLGGIASIPGKVGDILGGVGNFLGGLIPHFAVGALKIPRDMLAVVHKGEMIVPSQEAEAIRSGRSILPQVATSPAQGASSLQIPISVQGLIRAERPSDLARPIRSLAATGILQRRERFVPTIQGGTA